MEQNAQAAIAALRANGFEAEFFADAASALDRLFERLRGAPSISRGGSVTVERLGVLERIAAEGLPFRDYQSPEDRLASLQAHDYITGSNAVTADGKLVNVDGAGNRVAALNFGPRRVHVLAGVNKLVADAHAGLRRIRSTAAPLNAKRLNRKTPCVATGACMDCASPERICRKTSIVERPEPGRIFVYLIGEELGF